jgi:hypothetical protein
VLGVDATQKGGLRPLVRMVGFLVGKRKTPSPIRRVHSRTSPVELLSFHGEPIKAPMNLRGIDRGVNAAVAGGRKRKNFAMPRRKFAGHRSTIPVRVFSIVILRFLR